MKINPLRTLGTLGQSLWLDYISRELLDSGELRRLIDQDGLRGMTSNPAIFEKAIESGQEYLSDIRAMAREKMSALSIYEALSLNDVRRAADEFRSVYDRTGGEDGYVSLEVNPHLARETQGTIREARRLWRALDRPNVMIKVPGTVQGLLAIEKLTSEGINVNVTLLFGLPRYREVARAYCAGIATRVSQRKSVSRVASVASFFLSRIDVMVDPLLEQISARGGPQAALARKTRGQTAIASAKEAYQIYKENFEGASFQSAIEEGARPQRLLWASTGTKNPRYSDVKYIDALIGAHTVNTAPPKTIDAYRDHGVPKARLENGHEQAGIVLKSLAKLGISLGGITRRLENEGIDKFNEPFDKLLSTLENKRLAGEKPRRHGRSQKAPRRVGTAQLQRGFAQGVTRLKM